MRSGTILFIIYINDLCGVASQFDSNAIFKLFADDAKSYSCRDNLRKMDMMQRCLDMIQLSGLRFTMARNLAN